MNNSLKALGDYCFRFKFVSLLMLLLASACNAQQSEKSSQNVVRDEYVLLGLVGYNYTDRNISEYSVDGASGGHVFLSSPTSGGSGVTCCVKMLKKSRDLIQVRVRWQVDGCLQTESNPRTGASAERRVLHYKEADVNVQYIYKENPHYIETHFFPDGTVQVKLTEHGSSPVLALNEKRTDKSYFPRCSDGKNNE